MRFFSYGAEQDPFAKGRRLTFSFPKRKSYKKKLATLQVDRYANQLSRKSFFVPEGAVCFGKLYLHQKVRDTEFSPTRLFCQFDWRVGAYPSAPLALSPARRMGTDRRGAWKVSEFPFWMVSKINKNSHFHFIRSRILKLYHPFSKNQLYVKNIHNYFKIFGK